MTSLAFGFGVLPLALAAGAGAGAQKAIGTGVVGGVVTSTFLVIIFAPLFFVLVERIFGRQKEVVQISYGRRKTDRVSGPERRKND
jgi:Cu/Ag efflux pump CusA